MLTCRHGCQCKGGNLEVSGAECQVLGRLAAFQTWRKLGVGDWRGHRVSLEAIFKLNFFLIKNILY